MSIHQKIDHLFSTINWGDNKDKALAIADQLKSEIALDQALQQFTGFGEAQEYGCIVQLVEAMGLRGQEWHSIREDVEGLVSNSDFSSLEAYFSNVTTF